MRKRIDLNERHNNYDFEPNKQSHSFYLPEDVIDNKDSEEIQESSDIEEDENLNNQEQIFERSTDTKQEGNLNSFTNEAKEEAKSEVIKIALKNPVVRKVLLIAIPVIIFIILIVFIIAAISGEDFSDNMASGGYYDIGCNDVTVTLTDKDYNVTGTGTYQLEEYIAGVVTAEVGQFNNLEVFKEFAIAARSYFAANHSNCTIESSDRYQMFSPTPIELARQAADETAGKVLLQNNSLYGAIQYDAFACIGEEGDYYIISQGNQRVHKNWIENRISKSQNPNWFICNGVENLNEHHGNGLSQWGSLYLAQEENMKYDEILKYYLGDEVVISSSGLMSIAGLEIKNTSGAQTLYEPLSSFLPKNGLSVEDMNNYIHTSVANNGAGTRAGVVTAAVSIINYLYDNTGYKLPYYWNGKYYHIGINPNFGGYTKPSDHGQVHAGFDCSGFVSWAIINGGYNFSGESTRGFERRFGSYGCSITSRSCVGEPGDLINESNVHVQLIVSVDEANGVYYIAESSNGLNINAVGMHSGSSNKKIIHMDNFYNNEANKNYNY